MSPVRRLKSSTRATKRINATDSRPSFSGWWNFSMGEGRGKEEEGKKRERGRKRRAYSRELVVNRLNGGSRGQPI